MLCSAFARPNSVLPRHHNSSSRVDSLKRSNTKSLTLFQSGRQPQSLAQENKFYRHKGWVIEKMPGRNPASADRHPATYSPRPIQHDPLINGRQ